MFSKFLFGKSASGEQAAPKSSENCADTAVGCEFIDLDHNQPVSTAQKFFRGSFVGTCVIHQGIRRDTTARC